MATNKYQGVKFCGAKIKPVEDHLTVEEALQVFINNESFSITMRTPGNDNELVRGLLFTEDVLSDINFPFKPEWLKEEKSSAICKVNIHIPAHLLKKSYLSSRSLLSVSSCGICGNKELDFAEAANGNILESGKLDPSILLKMFSSMKELQKTFKQSGGSHASAAFTIDNELLAMHEDIGRHNAVDKVIGSLILQGKLHLAKCLLVSGRISYEIVAKCFRAHIPVLAAVSAPSSLAVDFAKELGITLVAFCREDKATVYSHYEKIKTTVNLKNSELGKCSNNSMNI